MASVLSRQVNSQAIVLLMASVGLLVGFNQYQLMSLSSGMTGKATVAFESDSLKALLAGLDGQSTLSPALLLDGEQPAVIGYKTKIKKMPTITKMLLPQTTGNVAQDVLLAITPKGTPLYAPQGISFDSPVPSLQAWVKVAESYGTGPSNADKVSLEGEKRDRWVRITNSFTCDFCCGSPHNPTIITQCGCSHSASARAIAALLIDKYGDQYSDEQIRGEMSLWKNLYYPGPTVDRILLETGSTGGAGSVPQMIGGC